MVDSLLDRARSFGQEEDYLDVLGDLIKRYEEVTPRWLRCPTATCCVTSSTPRGYLRRRSPRATGIARLDDLEVLKGKRSLNRSHIGKLARYFGVSADAFAF